MGQVFSKKKPDNDQMNQELESLKKSLQETKTLANEQQNLLR